MSYKKGKIKLAKIAHVIDFLSSFAARIGDVKRKESVKQLPTLALKYFDLVTIFYRIFNFYIVL